MVHRPDKNPDFSNLEGSQIQTEHGEFTLANVRYQNRYFCLVSMQNIVRDTNVISEKGFVVGRFYFLCIKLNNQVYISSSMLSLDSDYDQLIQEISLNFDSYVRKKRIKFIYRYK